MFKKNPHDQEAKQKNGKLNGNGFSPTVNMVSEGTSIEGEIVADSDIRIDGKLKGFIRSKAKVVVGATGEVDGEIHCESADILGTVYGVVKVKDILFLKGTGKIEGDIFTSKIVVESGAAFNGSCNMESVKQSATKQDEPRAEKAPKQEATV